MKSMPNTPGPGPKKAPTGIVGLDEITGGGLPHGRTTLLVGGPGSGKTIFALQFLAHGARSVDEPGIFVAFEENADRIVANAEGFGWNLPELRKKKLFFIDTQPTPDLIQSGNFDLDGMLAVLEAKVGEMGARRIVFDAIDIVLALLPDGEVTTPEDSQREQPFGFMQFMVDCSSVLNHCVVQGVSQRNLRVQKYRGSSIDENESPFLIGSNGFEVVVEVAEVTAKLKRVRLDAEEAELEKGVFMTPTLVKLGPLPERRIVGTLSQFHVVLQALGLPGIAA